MKEHVWPLIWARRWLVLGTLGAVVLSTAIQIAGPWLVKYAIDEGISKDDKDPLRNAALVFLVLAFAKPLVQRALTLLSARAGESFLADLRTATFDRLQELSLAFFEREKAGVLVSRLTADVQSLTMFVRMALVEIVSNLLLLAVTIAVLLALSPKLLLFAIVSVPLIVFGWAVYHHRSRPAYLAIRDSIAETLAALQERFAGVRVIQSFRRESDAFAGYDEKSQVQIAAWKRASYVNVGFFPMTSLAQGLGLSSVLIGGSILYDRGEVTIGTVAAFVLYVTSLFEPMARLAEWFSELRSGQAALAKIVGVLETRVSVPESGETRDLPGRATHAAADVGFAYEADRRVLDDVEMAIEPGERIALVGPTGAGKSTLAKLLTRKYDPVAGAIAFGDVDLRDASFAELRERIVFVPQEGHLFSGSIADNVRLARPDATDDEVRDALRTLGALERFERLPEGIATDVKTRGVRLSAGERQLVSLARVLLADPSVIVLDEATSSVDPGTERAVERALSVIAEGRTVITIAHRLSTAARADRVAVLEDGKLVDLGAHADLLTAGGPYARLWGAWTRDAAAPEPS